VAFLNPLGDAAGIGALAATGAAAFAVELIPRITRAQSMDALSSQSTVAGYKGVILGAAALPRLFPLLMTAAGTVTPAKVLVLGAGVAGLQAIATARRLGAVVSAFDVRPVVREQVESLGARFLEIELAADDAETAGGYAKELSEEAHRLEQELVSTHVAASDLVVSTALIPGRPAPVLITAEAVAAMRPGSVIVDLAADAGGNCALTSPGAVIDADGVTIVGTRNVAATVPQHASQLYAKNLVTLVRHLAPDGTLAFDLEDEITAATLVCRGGEVVHPRLRERPVERTA
jgi:NAD(P) transhydrogenase subunit alpha